MTIDTTLLTTTVECDNLLTLLQEEKVQLERRVRNLGEALESKSKIAQEVTSGIASVEALIAGYQAAVAVITENNKKRRNLELKIEQEEARLKALQNREADYNAVSIVEDQIDHSQLESQITVLEGAITTVTTRKTEL